MRERPDPEIEKIQKKNLAVYVAGLRNPYFMGDDNSESRWTHADVGRFFANTMLSLPLELRINEEMNGFGGKFLNMQKADIQAHLKKEFYNALISIEHYRKSRAESMLELGNPYTLVEMEPSEAEEYFATMDRRYPSMRSDLLTHAMMALNTQSDRSRMLDEDPLLRTFGLALQKGTEDYINLKKMNDIGKRIFWKPHREYDTILLHMVTELENSGFLEDTQELQDKITEDLARDGYKRDVNE